MVTWLWAIVLAPQRTPNHPSRRLAMGRYLPPVCAILPCSCRGAKQHRRRTYPPSAHRRARPVARVVDLAIANAFLQGSPLLVHPLTAHTPWQEFVLRASLHR
jgi:hypothetical protein